MKLGGSMLVASVIATLSWPSTAVKSGARRSRRLQEDENDHVLFEKSDQDNKRRLRNSKGSRAGGVIVPPDRKVRGLTYDEIGEIWWFWNDVTGAFSTAECTEQDSTIVPDGFYFLAGAPLTNPIMDPKAQPR